MKRLISISTAIFVSLASVAIAEPRMDWTGAYFGAVGSYSAGVTNPYQRFPTRNYVPSDLRGGMVGIAVGYNHQFASAPVVVGIEADTSYGAIKRSLWMFIGHHIQGDHTIDLLGSVRTRIGYAFDNLLLYGTGGFAWSRSRQSSKFYDFFGNVLIDFGSTTAFDTGYTVGGGLEYAIDRNWSAKFEYLYYDLGRRKYLETEDNFSMQFHAARIGLNYRF